MSIEEKLEREQREREVIARIRDMLMQGHQLTDRHCPRCGYPLIRDKNVNLDYCPHCNVYLATPEELKKAKIDLSKTPIYDFNEYWKMRERREKARVEVKPEAAEKRVESVAVVRRREERERVPREKVVSHSLKEALDSLLATLIDKLTQIIVESDLSASDCIKLLRELVELRKALGE